MAGFQQLRVTREVDFTGARKLGIGPFDDPGRTYYVNNITGVSTNDGLTWNSAMDQVQTAITASEVYRQLQGINNNDYIRNTIVVQGTATAYTAVTAIPNYCNLIGLGSDPRGNGTGIAKIDGAGAADAMSVGSAGCRGLYMVNLQFNSSGVGNYYGADFDKLFRSRIETCVFTNNGLGGLRIVSGGGVIIIDCASTNDTIAQLIGLTLGASATVNALKVVDCEWFGDTNGVSFIAVAGKHTVFKNCAAIGGTYGWIDTTPSQVGHTPWYIDCYGFGTNNTTINQTGFVLSNDYAKRSMRCIDNANGVSRNYPTTAD